MPTDFCLEIRFELSALKCLADFYRFLAAILMTVPTIYCAPAMCQTGWVLYTHALILSSQPNHHNDDRHHYQVITNSSSPLLNACRVPGTGLNVSFSLSHLILVSATQEGTILPIWCQQ